MVKVENQFRLLPPRLLRTVSSVRGIRLDDANLLFNSKTTCINCASMKNETYCLYESFFSKLLDPVTLELLLKIPPNERSIAIRSRAMSLLSQQYKHVPVCVSNKVSLALQRFELSHDKNPYSLFHQCTEELVESTTNIYLDNTSSSPAKKKSRRVTMSESNL